MTTIEQRRVLLVDAGLQKIDIMTGKRAFVLLSSAEVRAAEDKYFRKPQVLVYSEDGTVVGSEIKQRIPSVIQLGYVMPPRRQKVVFNRRNLLVGRDRCICQYCGQRFAVEKLTYEHVIPKTQGGRTTWFNVVAACLPCNQRKAGRTPRQAGMKLIREPVIPKNILAVKIMFDITNVPPEWRDYWDEKLLP
jgi:5-methylcytosine-specific restriction endonuclease McrA